ncbi:MAG TPA: phosphatase PAP2 family protein [Saprospiraceae bacterium]|nr:phosphatase PAP2 family protein [Saprospiraceae bacterium]
MLETIQSIDTRLLIWIHEYLRSDVLDWLMPLVRSKWTWAPLYVFLLAFMLFNFGKRGGLWALFFIFAIALSDSVSSKVIKYQVKRIRPCHTELTATHLHMLVPCGGQYGFTSSHASNHFAMATFLFFTLGRMMRRIRWPVIIWAVCIAFAQVYVGVHYPLDVIGGGVLGAIIGAGIAWYYNLRMKRWNIAELDA